jgi:alkylation response protein AidB-like acyl-CoA dehydrogenase
MGEFTANDRLLLEESLARFCEKLFPADRRRTVIAEADAKSTDTWTRMAELGYLGVGVPTAFGGSGGSMPELGLILRAGGRALMMEPLLPTAAVCLPLLAEMPPTKFGGELIAAALDGRDVLSLAHGEPTQGFSPWPISTRAERTSETVRILGRKSIVLAGPIAQHILVTANFGDGALGLFCVSAQAPNLRMRSFKAVDERWMADLVFDGTPGVDLSGGADVSPALERALERGLIALGFEALGCMEELVEQTRQHVKTRRAFGGTLSQFQTIQHRLVDMFVFKQEAEAIVEAAAAAYEEQSSHASRLAAAMKVHVCRASRFVAEGAVQLHGGLGVSDELLVSHYFKRLMMVEALYGGADHHLDRFIQMGSTTTPNRVDRPVPISAI